MEGTDGGVWREEGGRKREGAREIGDGRREGER